MVNLAGTPAGDNTDFRSRRRQMSLLVELITGINIEMWEGHREVMGKSTASECLQISDIVFVGNFFDLLMRCLTAYQRKMYPLCIETINTKQRSPNSMMNDLRQNLSYHNCPVHWISLL